MLFAYLTSIQCMTEEKQFLTPSPTDCTVPMSSGVAGTKYDNIKKNVIFDSPVYCTYDMEINKK